MTKPSILFLCFTCFAIASGIAQSLKVGNIHHRVLNDKIQIFYDLPENSDSVNVEVFFHKKSHPGFRYHPHYLSGDHGIGVYSGINKKIIWSYKKEPAYVFKGNGFYFRIKAIKIPKEAKLQEEKREGENEN